MNAETKEKIKTLLNQIGDLVVVEDKKNEDKKVQKDIFIIFAIIMQ